MDDELLAVRVECYAGARGEETPRCLYLGPRRIRVEAVLDQWLAPEHRYFRLRGEDGGVYVVRYDIAADRWELTLFDSGRAADTRLSST